MRIKVRKPGQKKRRRTTGKRWGVRRGKGRSKERMKKERMEGGRGKEICMHKIRDRT